MKVLLVVPIEKRKNTIYYPPLGLGYLASAIRNEHDVRILDCRIETENFNAFEKYIREYAPDLVGFTVYSNNISNVNKHLEIVKNENKNIITVIGGPHSSAVPYLIFEQFDYLDFGFQSECEKSLPMYLNGISENNISGFIWKNSFKVMVNDKSFENNLDLFSVSWDKFKLKKYKCNINHKNEPVAPMIATRGCPYKCTFCSASKINGKKVRYRSVESVIREVAFLKYNYGVNEIHFLDDNFTFDKDFVIDFCKRITEYNLDITFQNINGVRLDTLDEEMLIMMKKAGWYLLYIGVESGCERTLKNMKKELDLKTIEEKVNLVKKVGMDIMGFFIIGFPGETKQDIIETIKFSNKLNIDWATFHNFAPLPGTEIVEKENIDLKETTYFNGGINYASGGISIKQLKRLSNYAYFRFYLKPKRIIKLLKELKIKAIIRKLKNMFFYE